MRSLLFPAALALGLPVTALALSSLPEPEPRTLLVAVDTLTGEARAVRLYSTEDGCWSSADRDPVGDGKAHERLECRGPK
jgi:hypothetical protein